MQKVVVNYLPSKVDHDEKDMTNYVRAEGYVEDGSGNGDKDEDTMLAQLADGEFVSRADAVLGAGIMAGANPSDFKEMRKGRGYILLQPTRSNETNTRSSECELNLLNLKKFEVENVWSLARDLVQLACETNGAFDADDIKDLCKQGAMQLWLVIDETDEVLATVVTELRSYPNYKVCDARIVTGRHMSRWHHHVADLETWAKAKGCKKNGVVCKTRMGESYETKKGYAKSHVQLEKDL